MRGLTYYVATTIDGFIAREDGSFHEFPWDDAFGAELLARFPETFPAHLRTDSASNKRFDTVLMGRRTYEVGLREGITSPYPTLRQHVFSRTLAERPDLDVILVAGDAVETVRGLKDERGKGIWLCGGSELASTLYEAALIDELVIKLNPVAFGAGIPLFRGPVSGRRLNLLESEAFPSGHMLLRYGV